MASDIPADMVELFKRFLNDVEPYPISVLDDLMLDDKRYDHWRVFATYVLKHMLDAGFSEDEVNPWKNKT